MPEGLSGSQKLFHRLVLHRWGVRRRKVVEILPSHKTSASNACASVSWQRWARCSRSGWPAVSPPWGLSINPPPTEGVQSVLNIPSYFLSYFLPDFSYIQHASYISYILGLPPLSFSLPRRMRIPPGRPKMSGTLSLLGSFFRFFGLLKNCWKNASKKHRKK